MECGQIFLLACRQLQKKGQHNLNGQFKNLCDVPTLALGASHAVVFLRKLSVKIPVLKVLGYRLTLTVVNDFRLIFSYF